MNLDFWNNQLFSQCLRGPTSNRRYSTPQRKNRITRASFQIDTSQLNKDNSLAQSAIRSVSRQRDSIQTNRTIDDATIKQKTLTKKSTLMRRSSNIYRQVSLLHDCPKQIILIDHTKDQPDVILNYLPEARNFLNKQNHQILQGWIPTLPQEDRKSIEKNKKYFPIPRNIPYHEIIDGLNIVYGQGKNRRLWPGEEALLMETIRMYIEKIQTNPKLLLHSVTFTLQQIVRLAGLEDIQKYKLCMQQLECHWKMMITRFRYSGQNDLNKKSWQHWFEQGQLRGHFLNLQQDNLLTQYLLKHQQID